MSIATLALVATLFTGQPCAVIDNTSNTAAFAVPGERTITRHYRDYGDNLGYDGRVPRRAWAASRHAEASLTIGAPGPKTRLACSR